MFDMILTLMTEILMTGNYFFRNRSNRQARFATIKLEKHLEKWTAIIFQNVNAGIWLMLIIVQNMQQRIIPQSCLDYVLILRVLLDPSFKIIIMLHEFTTDNSTLPFCFENYLQLEVPCSILLPLNQLKNLYVIHACIFRGIL